MNPLRMVFCGTPPFAVPCLKLLRSQKEFEILAVYTQPDRPSGRGQEVTFSAVKQEALASGLRVHQPRKMTESQVEEELSALAPDVVLIIAYGQLIPARLLGIPRLGWINLHASLLPRYRGAAPVHWAIAKGETRTGNTTMRIDAGMDTGAILLQQELPIDAEVTAPELTSRLAEAGAGLMVETLRGLRAGTITPRAQDHARATLAPRLRREDGRIAWKQPASEIYNRMRGFAPWPGAYTTFRGETCHLWGRPLSSFFGPGNPGTLLLEPGRLVVVCGGATGMELTHVKREGRKQVNAAEFANGAHLLGGEQLGKM